ncbi:MAG: VWA domain-containing protein [Chloroflexaceae bacterium]|nr:VWA domain-containing protein [Chloroflexaceae bacterium]
MLFHNPQLLLLLLVLPILIAIWRWRGMRLAPAALVLRIITVVLLVLAVADPSYNQEEVPLSPPVVVLVDQSDSLTPEGQAFLRSEAARLVEQLTMTDEDSPANQNQRLTTLWFGDHVVAAGDGEATGDTDVLLQALDPSESNLAGALRTARQLVAPAGNQSPEPAHDKANQTIWLITDGIQTTGDAQVEAYAAANAGLTINVVPVDPIQQPEVRISSIQTPRSVHMGEEYPVHIVIANGLALQDVTADQQGLVGPAQGTLRLWQNQALLAEEQVTIDPGDTSFTFRTRAETPGVSQIRVEIEAQPDTFDQNNTGSATTLVTPPSRILIVEGREGNSFELSSALWSAGIESEVIQAEQLPSRLSELQAYDGMVLVDVPGHILSLDQMTSVQEFVRSEGRGLVVTGGQNSFGLGAYQDSPLEQVLPVTMDPPPRDERGDVAMLLIIDRSASMTVAIGTSKFDMAKEAAILATETLQSNDSIGVLAFDTRQDWVIQFQRIGEGLGLKQIQDTIALLGSGGGTDIYGALQMGLSQLSYQDASVRHVVLLTDGRSFTNDYNAYQMLAETARDEGITISAIAIGRDSDTQLLDQLAQWGGGRYYYAEAADDIPRLTLRESEIARTDPSVEGTFQADLTDVHPLLRDFVPAELPSIDGYVATTVKDGAEMVLESPDDTPVLAAWQYGLGRAVAWTPSVTAPWAENWSDWSEFGPFWAQIVRYTLPAPESTSTDSPLTVQLEPRPGGARLVVDALEASGESIDLADVAARITLPDGNTRDVGLRQVAPGRYVQDLVMPTPGAYTVLVVLDRQGERHQTEMGYVYAPAAEYNPPAEVLYGLPLLNELTQITGGSVMTVDDVSNLRAAEVPETVVESPTWLQQGTDWLPPIWLLLLTVALITWVLEIAVRRGFFIRDR